MIQEDAMPCFNCEAFFDDELCYKKRHTIDENGVEGLGCPRIKKELDKLPKGL